jgi:hypothetical protein
MGYSLSGDIIESPYHVLTNIPGPPYLTYGWVNEYSVNDGGADVLVTQSAAAGRPSIWRRAGTAAACGGRLVEHARNAPQSLRIYPAVMAEDGSLTREVYDPDNSLVSTLTTPTMASRCLDAGLSPDRRNSDHNRTQRRRRRFADNRTALAARLDSQQWIRLYAGTRR